ncbi:MAG TPA: hypothetical protein VJV79_27325 [Polyangiaceae bacterium]|nr:hypothetical protein [Polyangiaceae bacterium]
MMLMRLGWLGLLLATGCLARPVVEVAPETSNLFVDQIEQTSINKIDLLFMIDNSGSMSDKQEILKDAVPVLLARLVSPICVDGAGKPTGVNALANGQCPDNKGQPEFNPIADIHIGVVSSSLGAHGGQECAEAKGPVVHPDDRAHLIGSMRPNEFPLSKSWDQSGFLAWDPSGKANTPPGTANPGALNTAFQDMIGAVGENGCGYEASLESWYRFLVDPEPPANVTRVTNSVSDTTVRSSKLTVNADGSLGPCVGCDEALLAQRRAFLRPDSLLAIVMLSDENDCSIRDDGSGWLIGMQDRRMPRATAVCATNPNDPCCRSCAQREDKAPDGCAALTADPVCMNIPQGLKYAVWDEAHDSRNLRCYNQHQRFGFDLLYEPSRYVDALTKTTLRLQSNSGTFVPNPLFDAGATGKSPRHPSLVFLAGIVGVPWQDIADEASLSGPGLNYLTAKELAEKGRWRAILGDPNASPPLPPSDPFMVETPEERVGTNPITGTATSPSTSTNPRENPINGHERNLKASLDDLQYACTFRLKTPKTCDPAELAAKSPLCEGGMQTSAKAYPGSRALSVLKGLGENAIVASICPKVIEAADPSQPSADPNYGYNPAVSAILARLKIALVGKCLPRTLEADDRGQVLCRVVEAQRQKQDCNCQLDGRAEVSPDIVDAVQDQLQLTGQCGGLNQKACSDWCMCEIKQVEPAHLKACQTNQGGVPAGYCYIDDQAKVGADATSTQAIEAQLALCPVNQRHRLRFVDADPTHKTPADGAFAFISCRGAAIPKN